MKYFSYDPINQGFAFHDTKESAQAAARNMLDIYRLDAISEEGWDEETSMICWGQIAEQATELKRENGIDYTMEQQP